MNSDTELSLKGNDIRDEGASHVAKMLYFNECLHLDVSENPIGDTGSSLIFEAVRKTAVLKILILIGCTTLADLLPVENDQEIAAELSATNERGVLWVLDKLPHHLQDDPIFCKNFPLKHDSKHMNYK